MRKSRARPSRIHDRAEVILDDLYDDRNGEIRAACRKIIRGASRGLAIYEELQQVDAAARAAGERVLPHPEFLNIHGLLWILELELASLLDDYIRSRDERRWLYARLLLLSLYESTKSLRSIFSRSYRLDVEARLGSEHSKRIADMHGYIDHAFEDLDANYGHVRNHLLGHRDRNAALRWKAISSLNGLDIKDFAWEVLEWCAQMALLDKDYLAAIDGLNTKKGGGSPKTQ